MQKEIVYFSSVKWDFLYQRPHHILSSLATEGFRVIFVDPYFSPPRLRTKLFYQEKVLLIEPGINLPFLTRHSRNLIDEAAIIVMKATDSHAGWITSVNKMNDSDSIYTLLRISVQAIMRLSGISKPALWTNQPFWLPVMENLTHKSLIYDCLDEISGFEGNSDVLPFEGELLKKANLVLCTAERLYKRCLLYNSNSYLLPNAVDFNHFNSALSDRILIPDDTKQIPPPIIGYIGCVGHWFDVDLLIATAAKNRQWSFLIIGPIATDIPPITHMPPNIYLIGKRDYRDLPRYLKQFDVGIIPFKITSLTLSTDPVKLYEYFAAGVPVVSTALPEVSKYRPNVSIATDAEQFSREIALALKNKNVSSYLDIAMQNTWQRRCRDVMALLERI